MADVHKYLGEGILAIYVVLIIVGLVMERRGKGLPAAITGIGHGLLAVQVALGLMLLGTLDSDQDFNWLHPIFGFLAFGSLILMRPMREKLGANRGMVASFAMAAVFVLAAYLITLSWN